MTDRTPLREAELVAKLRNLSATLVRNDDAAITWGAADALESRTPPLSSPEQRPSAYLKFWFNEGRPCCRMDLTDICEPWLDALKPTITPLYTLEAARTPPLSSPEQITNTELHELIDRLKRTEKRTISWATNRYVEPTTAVIDAPINPDGPEAATELSRLAEDNERLREALRGAIELLDDCEISHPFKWDTALRKPAGVSDGAASRDRR